MVKAQNPAQTPPGVAELRRLGKNINGYFGETIDLPALLSGCIAAAHLHEWQVEEIRAGVEPAIPALVRRGHSSRSGTAPSDSSGPSPVPKGPEERRRIYVSAGIHGDEPAGPLAVRRLLEANAWPHNLDLWVCPCLNPAGFRLNRRHNAAGVDLNRDYLHPRAAETVAHIGWLERQPAFDLCLCLHEDWEAHGFYIYELNPENRASCAESIVERVSAVCPIDCSETIEGRPAQKGVIRPNLDPRSRPDWPEAFYLLTNKTRVSYTLEAPSDYPLSVRVAALTVAVQAALELVGGEKQ